MWKCFSKICISQPLPPLTSHQEDLFGLAYVGILYVQRGHGIGSYLTSLFRAVKPLAIRSALALGRESLKTKAQIPPHIGNKELETKVNIMADLLAESAQRLVARLQGGELTRKRESLVLIQRKRRRRPRKRRLRRRLRLRKTGGGRV